MKKIIFVVLLLGAAQWWFRSPVIDLPQRDVRLEYLVKISGSASKNEALPMLIALHGNEDTPLNFFKTAMHTVSTPSRMILIKGPIKRGRGGSWPWAPEDFERYGTSLGAATQMLSEKYPTIGKPVLLGFSGGGMMAYYQAIKYGDKYSYIIPVSGQLSESQLGQHNNHPGATVFAFHGRQDQVISLQGAWSAVSLLRAQGITVTFQEFEGDHHGLFTYMNPVIISLVDQKLKNILP